MKVVIYMAMTANGLIAAPDDSAAFLTKEESDSYVAIVKSAKNLIIGRRTYEILSTQPEFQEFLKANIKIVVVSRGDISLKDISHRIAHSPKEALNLFSNDDTVIIAGGGILNTAFMKEDLVDEIYLDIEPAFIGRGQSLFKESDFECDLRLLGVKQLSPNEVQLHFEVL